MTITIKFNDKGFRSIVANYIEDHSESYTNDIGFLEAMHLFENEDNVEISLPFSLEDRVLFISNNHRVTIERNKSNFISHLIEVLKSIKV